jgi:hypothetical protein
MANSVATQWQWPLWGVAAGVLGYIGHLATDDNPTGSTERRLSVEEVVASLDRKQFHIGVVAGMLAVFCLLVFAAGWRRWANREAKESLAASVVSLALIASAGAMILGYGFKGALAVYLPGGMDDEMHTVQGLYSLFMFIDFAPYMAWYGVAMAAAAMAWLSLRERRIPIWFGVLGAIFVIVPLGFLVATGLPGFPGVVDPFWLIVTSIGLAVTLRRQATMDVRAPRQTIGAEAGSPA